MEKGFTIPVHDHGFVRYVDHMGSDMAIVEAARVSFASPSKGEEQDRKLIHYLFRNRHTSPFEMVKVKFDIKMPILLQDEVERAEKKHPQWGGRRYGHSVIEEEYAEFRDALFADNHDQAFLEVIQLGAMCIRYIKENAPSSVRLFH